eukprot:scaffold580386_cov24-Prasinocladus_malaysianus.AAC.1
MMKHRETKRNECCAAEMDLSSGRSKSWDKNTSRNDGKKCIKKIYNHIQGTGISEGNYVT